MINNIPRWFRDFAPLLVWMGLIFFLSHQPRLVDFEQPLFGTVFFKSAHVTVYAILAWLWWRALTPHRAVAWPILGLAFSLTVLYGISDEVHQLYIPGRNGRLYDILFDASGALAMILLIRWYGLNYRQTITP